MFFKATKIFPVRIILIYSLVDFTMPFLALTYLTLYRLDELGAVHYRKFVMTQNITKMHKVIILAEIFLIKR